MWGRKDKNTPMNTDQQTPDAQQTPAEQTGGDIDAADQLQARIAELEAERDELNQKYLRTLAEYHNSQKRAVANENEAKLQGVTGVVLNLLRVLDSFDLALGQDPAKATAEQIVAGVRVIRDDLLKILSAYNVAVVSPSPGDEFDAHRHQAVMQENAETVEPGRIVRTLQAGYTLGDRVVRPAMVAVRPRE